MGFLKRLGWYLIGLSIGIVFLFFFLKKKSGENGIEFCYLPNCRVLKDIRSKKLIGPKGNTFTFSEADSSIQKILTKGKVDFKRSETQTSPCKTYHIEDPESETLILKIKNCEDAATIEEVSVKKS